MAKYRALRDYNADTKKGDVVEFKDKLDPGLASWFEPVGGKSEDGDKERVGNPDRDELKLRATELGIQFANNTPTPKLMEMISEKEAELKEAAELEAAEAAEAAAAGGGDD